MESDNYFNKPPLLIKTEKLCPKCSSNLFIKNEEKKLRAKINCASFKVTMLICPRCKHKVYSKEDLDNFASIKLELRKIAPDLLELMRLINNYKLVKIFIKANFPD
jgi:hypothetical protein